MDGVLLNTGNKVRPYMSVSAPSAKHVADR